MSARQDQTEVVLHIGAHRTGTTALQRALDGQTQQLAAVGIAFWGPKELRKGEFVRKLADLKSASLIEPGSLGARAGIKEPALPDLPFRRLIVSDENFSGSMYRNWTQGTLYPEVPPQFRAVLRLLPAPPAAIHFTLRDFAGYWQSVFAHLQRVRRVPLFEAARLSESLGNSWLPALRAIRFACPEVPIHLARYDRTAAHRVMAALVGPEIAKTLHPPRQGVNASRPAAGHGTSARFSADETERLDRAFDTDWAEIVRGVVPGVVVVAGPDPAADEPKAIPRAVTGSKRTGRTNAIRRGTERTTQ